MTVIYTILSMVVLYFAIMWCDKPLRRKGNMKNTNPFRN